ncbi:MAG: DNA replication and repair protein RecF [Cyclobacteriaceae bacterium]|jgi:DNA replication and repair protein RecF
MLLKTLKLQYFKNYSDLDIHFSDGINCILGKNGMGKTNLLDAIYYLSMTRSALSNTDQQNITYSQPYFSINGNFKHEGKVLGVNSYFEKGKKKLMKVDGKEPEKLSDHIGRIPSVLTTPDDTEIIKEGSEIRRKLFDSVIAQFDHKYLKDLMELQHLLKQRNTFLKQNEGRKNINRTLMAVYDEKLHPLNLAISNRRLDFAQIFESFFSENYKQLFSGNEKPGITYKTDCLDEDFKQQFHQALEKDIILQRTTVGCHKDDYIFTLNDRPVKKFGSQGQQKSFIIALKLAEYDFLKAKTGFNPLLLLDDIFDKLDDERISHLVTLLSNPERFPQLFITDAREERSRAFFKNLKNVSFFEVSDGKII